MADLATGLSKTVVQLLADKVKSAIKEEAEKWQIVERDLVFITGEFEMMQSFLDTADEEHVKNKVVRTWVRQVRDLSYDVEDCIEFVLHLDTKKRTWWLRLLPSCGKQAAALPVDEAVTQIMQLKARVVDVSQRNIRYNLITDSGSKPVAEVQRNAATSTDILIAAAKMQGGHPDLIKLVTRDDTDLQVISVWGTGGDHGKISIIKNAFDDSIVRENFGCRGWVKLTHPFNPKDFIQNLVTQFDTNSCQEQGGAIIGLDVLKMMEFSQGDVVNEFMEQVNNKYLIILEDISTMGQWHAIMPYLPDRKNGSRIIVSTQQLEIARLCTGQPCQMLELSQLAANHSVCIFFVEGFQHNMVHSFNKEEPYHSLHNYGLLRRDSEVDELFEQIQERHLISVWGMPGVGKSVLVGAIYYKPRANDKFKKQAWVNVCYPFNPTDFCRILLVDLHSESTSMEQTSSKLLEIKDPIKECRRLLDEFKCLVVIDGLQYKDDWDWIKSNLIHGDSGSCVIIITSEESVAKHCAVSSRDASYNIKGLEAVAAHELLKKVLEENGCYLEQQMKGEADLILSKCGGLPKVVVTVARYLATRPRDVLKQEMRRLSDNFMYELETNPEFGSLRGILAWMHSYLHACPRHLKKSMLYISIFPQDSIIQRRRLVRRWIAEGYSKGTDSISLEKHAEMLFEEVAALSIMQPVLEASKVIGYQVNGFFRDYILSRPVEDRVFSPVEVSVLEQGHGRLTTEGIGQHLAIASTWDWDCEAEPVVLESLDLSRIRSLTVFGCFWSHYVSDRMRVLRVLDLENAFDVTAYVVDKIGKLLARLKFLSLRGQRNLFHLPDSVGELMQLQTLDIRDTSIVTLPPWITRLRKLQYIRAGTTMEWTHDDSLAVERQTTMEWTHDDSLAVERHPTPSSKRSKAVTSRLLARFRRRGADGSCSGGVEVPREIRRLKALHTLGAVHLNSNAGWGVFWEVLYSHHLKKLELSGINRKTISWILGSRLESLSLQFEKTNHFLNWSAVPIPTTLRSLKMQGHVEQLPQRIKDLGNLLKLTLEKTTLFTPDDMIVLGSLPSLRTLRLRVNTDPDGELQFPANLFSKLQVLEIASKSKLHVKFDEGAMEKLEQFRIHCLQGSEMQFSGLEHPVSLKQVWLLGSFDDALQEALQQQLPKLQVEPRPTQAPRS
ncbi:unnamed protein product [Urochloa decumbens]|uniref:Disease resistance protein RPM1 n=1 Tax=Urochloa decumbens TaxID=240449 RepID=A0ABC9B5M1_9POAL